jgi:hypothetical protein
VIERILILQGIVMAFGDAIISTASGREDIKAAALALRGIALPASNGAPLHSRSNIDLIAFDVAAHRASTAAFQ